MDLSRNSGGPERTSRCGRAGGPRLEIASKWIEEEKVPCRTVADSCSRSSPVSWPWPVVVGTVIADELLGVISKVDVEGKKITVIEKDTDKEIEIKITDETEAVQKKKGERGYAREGRPREAGEPSQEVRWSRARRASTLKVTHEKGVASKIEYQVGRKKKAE